MAKNIARYAVTSGLSGCYMPDCGPWAFEATTRRELASIIRYEIENAGFPASTFAQANLRRLWSFIADKGSSCAHFSIQHAGREIAFQGLTEDEYSQYEED